MRSSSRSLKPASIDSTEVLAAVVFRCLSLSLSIFFKEQQRLSTQGQGIGIPGTPYLRLSEDRYFSYMTHL